MADAPRFFVAITTCDRPAMLADLLAQLRAASFRYPNLEVAVFDDASRTPFIETPAGADLFRHPAWSYYLATERRGKPGFWATWNRLLGAFRASEATHLVTLPDDCAISDWFLDVIEGAMCSGPWRGRADGGRTRFHGVEALNTHVDGRNVTGCWGTGKPVRTGWAVQMPEGELPPVGLERVGWLDGFNALSRKAVSHIGTLDPIMRSWNTRPQLGSGVGAQIGARLRAGGVVVYGLTHSIVKHLGVESVMNPAARRAAPLTTLRFLDDCR